jgi:hypothetical protein
MRYRLAMLAAGLVSAPALADWEVTHWGDPVEAVIAATGAKADQGGADQQVWNQDQRATRMGDFHGFAAKWLFFFDAKGGLSLVKIEPVKGTDCPAFLSATEAPLGKPTKTERKSVSIATFLTKHWADHAANLAILTLDLGGTALMDPACHIIFQPYGNGKPGKRN